MGHGAVAWDWPQLVSLQPSSGKDSQLPTPGQPDRPPAVEAEETTEEPASNAKGKKQGKDKDEEVPAEELDAKGKAKGKKKEKPAAKAKQKGKERAKGKAKSTGKKPDEEEGFAETQGDEAEEQEDFPVTPKQRYAFSSNFSKLPQYIQDEWKRLNDLPGRGAFALSCPLP